MENIDSNLFDTEKAIIKEARELISSKKYDERTLFNTFKEVVDQLSRMVRDSEKIIRISDGQQEYLHKIQSDLKHEIEDRIRAEEKLKYIAVIDSLTGCYNRGMGINLLQDEINSIRRKKGCFSVCYIDINNLKCVNDKFGHFEGDELIVMTCKCIKDCLGDNDILFRLGGDEFMAVFPDCSKVKAEQAIKSAFVNVEDENKKKIKPYNVSFSYGIIQVGAEDNFSIDYIIQLADAEMYKFKGRYKTESRNKKLQVRN